MRYGFGDYTLDTQRYELRRAGQRVPLRPKVFQVLAYLLTHRDRVVSKEELRAHGWPGQCLSEETLSTCITAARQAVGDSGAQQYAIQTRRGYGYRFVAAVEEDVSEPGALAVGPGPPPPPAAPPLPALAPLSCAACQHLNPPASRFCGACGLQLGASELSGASDPCLVAPEPQTTPVPPGERKQVTVLAGALAPDLASAALAPEAWDTLRRQFFVLAQQAVQRYAGTMQHIGDDGFLALFGAPTAQEDHAQRAVLAALSLQQDVRPPGTALARLQGIALVVQLGVHTGQVVVGPLADAHPPLMLAVGDTLRVAVRLRNLAAPGTILLSAATRSWVHGVVYGETVTQDHEASLEVPPLAYEVLRVAPQVFPWPSGQALSPFVGRDRELAVLQAVLAQVEAGHGHVVGLVGDPGMGKSRLLYEFQRQVEARSLTYLVGGCVSYGCATPYLPLRDCLRQAWELTEDDPPAVLIATVGARLQRLTLDPEAWAPALLSLLGVETETAPWAVLSAPQRRAQTFEALLHVSLHTSRQCPLVLAIENLHWIDPTSEAWLGLLAERLAGVPLLLLTTTRPGYRPPWIDKSYALQLALPRLTAPNSQRVVQARHPAAPMPEPLLRTIIARADGNPFFLEELAFAAGEQGDDVPPAAIPDTIQAVLATRLDRVSTAAKQVAQVAAVLGREVTAPLLQAVLTLPNVAQRQSLLELQVAEILYEFPGVPASTYTFKHALLQEVAYASLLTRPRQQVHLRVAQVLAAQFPETAEIQPELVAYHYTAAGCTEQAVLYWQRAGQCAIERSADVEAMNHFMQGLELLKTLSDTPEHAQQEFTILIGLWRLYFSQARIERARELAAQCFTLAQRLQDVRLLQAAHMALGSTLLHCGEYVAARSSFEQGIALYDPQQYHMLAFSRSIDPGVVCLARLAWTLWMLGYAEQALERSRKALAHARDMSHTYSLAFALHFAGLIHQCRREVQVVQELAEAEMALSSAQEFAYWSAGGRRLHGWVLAQQEMVEEGVAQMRQGLDSWLVGGNDLGKAQILAQLADAYGKAGQAKEGLSVLATALTAVHKTGERQCEAEIYRLKGELLLAVSPNKSAEAEACFQQALAVARCQQAKSYELRAAMSLSRLWQQQGKRAEAYDLLAPIYGWFTEGFDTADLQEAKALLEALAG